MKAVYIKWEDTNSEDSWQTKEEMEQFASKSLVVEQLGFIYKETRKHIILIGGFDINGELHHQSLKIPKKDIILLKELNVEKYRKVDSAS